MMAVKNDGILSRIKLQASTNGTVTARSSPMMRCPTLPILINQSKSGNESQNRMKHLESSFKHAEEPVSQYIPSCLANRSDQQMSENDSEEEGNSTRKFCCDLKPDNFADQKFERDQVMLNIPSKHEHSQSSISSEYKTCENF